MHGSCAHTLTEQKRPDYDKNRESTNCHTGSALRQRYRQPLWRLRRPFARGIARARAGRARQHSAKNTTLGSETQTESAIEAQTGNAIAIETETEIRIASERRTERAIEIETLNAIAIETETGNASYETAIEAEAENEIESQTVR